MKEIRNQSPLTDEKIVHIGKKKKQARQRICKKATKVNKWIKQSYRLQDQHTQISCNQ